MLGDPTKISIEIPEEFLGMLGLLTVDPFRSRRQRLPELRDRFASCLAEVIDEIQWILDLVGDTGGKLAE